MSFTNPLLVELVVPKSVATAERISGFYADLGWEVRDDTHSEGYTYVSPKVESGPPPVIVYGLNDDPLKTAFMSVRQGSHPSQYSNGPSLPFAFDLVEICMAVPGDEDVTRLYEQGGDLLQRHIHVPLREYYGVKEYRFIDPFNYVIRVTVDPGWES